MKIPFVDLSRAQESELGAIQSAIGRVLARGHYVLGPECLTFEKEMGQSLRAPGEVIGCNSGTDALILPLLALGIKSGDEVIVPAHTAIPTVCAIRAVGATPVFADIDPDTWLLNPQDAQSKVTSRTRAVIVVHLYGAMAPIPQLPKSIAVIEDVAQAQGARWLDQEAGTLGDFGAFSFYPTKNLGALGDGGAVFCANPDRVADLRMLRFYGQKGRYEALIPRGINSRLDEMQAAVLRVRLPNLRQVLQAREVLVDRYRDGLSGQPLKFQRVLSECKPAWHLCVIQLESREVRDTLQKHLADQGIECLIHYPFAAHKQPAFADNRESFSLPIAEDLTSRILSLPLNTYLTESEQERVMDGIRLFFKRSR